MEMEFWMSPSVFQIKYAKTMTLILHEKKSKKQDIFYYPSPPPPLSAGGGGYQTKIISIYYIN